LSLLLKRPQHALLPWRVIFVITFLFVLSISALVSYINSAVGAGCSTSTTTSGDFTIVSITTTGTCDWSVPSYVNNVDLLVVGGGGAGGSANNGAGGGGGGGQVKTQTNYSVSGTLTISVGAGGVPTATADMSPGGDGGTTSVTPSSGSAITAIGGSGGASVTPAGNGIIGSPSNSGFNGGGGSVWASSVTNGSAGMAGGFAGGNSFGSGVNSDVQAAGGGGGSGAIGSNAASSAGGNGGIGLTSSVTSNATYYGGGGGGGKRNNNGTSGTGGTGGGGNGGKDSVGANGTANTGGGGGGAGGASVSKQGGSGGSGIVVIKFISQCNPTIATNLTNNYRYTFTNTGVCNWVTPNSSTSFKVLVVGAGGGGGYDSGGGGGGGAISYNSALTFSANEILTLTIGSGGAGGTSGAKAGVTGGTSSVVRSGSTIASSLGGSGGGGCNWNGSSCQGVNAGGNGGTATASGWTTYPGANGGRGFMFSAGSAAVNGIDGTSFFSNYYSGGGGGGQNANGGLGGGGNGSGSVAGTANTGGGGGGGNGNTTGGLGGSGILLFVNDFDTPTLSWTSPSADETVTSASYTPSWTLSDSTSGISSSSGTAKRQFATLTNGTCGSWTTEATQTRASPITLTSGFCYRWTFDSSLATGATLPADSISTQVSSNLTSSIVKFDLAPTISTIVSNSSDGIYNQDKTITFTVTFSETVTVTGNPILTLETGSNDLEATCSQSSVSTTMTCSATVRSGDASSDLDYVSTSALTLPAGVTIQDLYALNNAILTLPTPGQSGSIAFSKNIVIAGNSSNSATGGSVTYANGYAVHTYTSTAAGQSFVPSSNGNYEVLVVGGGGGGGSNVGSGGGGGAVVEQTLALINGTSYAITVGGGGAGASGATGQNIASDGTSSIFSNLITAPNGTGGRSRALGDSGTGNRGTGGNPGGGNGGLSCNFAVCSASAAIGSNGTLSSITGNYYGGGGGRGGQYSVGYENGFAGGLGGGGNGGAYSGSGGQNASANSGGGGGGGSESSGRAGGNGADGIIVIRYKIDNAAPVISWTTPSSTSYVSTASYTPVWSVTDSGIAGISNSGTVTRQYKSLSSGTCSGSWTNDGTFSSNTAQTLTANRCYQWTFSTSPVDNASNTTSTNLTSETVIYDSSAPSVTSFTATTSSPTANTTLEYQLNFSESVTGLASNDFTVSGWSVAVTSGSGSGPYVITLTKTSAGDGSVSLVLGSSAVTDIAGNTLSSILSSRTAAVISYDGTAPTTPTISLNSSTCSSLRNSSATATFSATDATSGMSGYRYTTDGSTPTSSSTSGSSVSVSSQGITTIKVRAIDNVGNLSATASCVLDIDYIVPLGVWSSQPSTPTSQTSLSYVLTFDQIVTGFSSSDLSISGTASGCSASVSGSGSSYTVTLASCSQGTIQLTLLANSVTDAHGNAGPAANASATQVTRSVLSVATDQSTLSYTYGSAITAVIPVSNSGGISSVSYSVSPSLPSGLSLNSSTGEITGTPSAKSSLNTYTISVADSATTATSTFTLVVAAKGLTVTASSPSVTYGDSIPAITPSYSGFVLGDTSSVVSGTSCSTTYTTSSSVNSTPTTSCSGATAGNYSFTYVSGTVTISKASQTTLTLSTTSGTYGNALTLTSSGGSGTGGVTYAATTGTASSCSVSGSSLTAGSAGTCLVTVTKATDTNYLSGSSSQITVTFARTSQSSISISSTSGTYGTSLTLITSGGTGAGTITYSATTGTASSCTVSGTSLTAGSAGTCLVTATKADDTNYLSESSTQTTITFAKSSQSGLTITTISGTYATSLLLSTSGGSGTGSVTYVATTGTASSCTVSGTSLTAGSTGTCLVTATKADDTNYLSVSTSQTTVTFAKAEQSTLTVTTSSVNGIYGATYTIGTSGGSGTGNVTYSVISGNCSLSGTTISNTSAGDCYLQATKAADTNYNSATSSNLKFIIAQKTLVLVASSPTVTYGQSYSPTIIDTNSALVGSDAIGSASYSYSTSSPTNAGTYTITPSAAVFSSGSINNYTVFYSTGTLTISKANQSTLSAVLATTTIQHRQTTTISSSGGSGSGAVTYSATGDCLVSGNEISTIQSGSCSLVVTKATSENYNSASSSPVTLTITGDTSSPTVVIVSNAGAYSNSDSLTYSLTFSEDISGLTISDITAAGWTKAITGSGSSYTLTLSSPDVTAVDGTITVTLASGSVTDGTNLNATSVTNTETIRDTVSPTTVASFVSYPASGTPDTAPQFVFGGAGAGEIYQCRINSGNYATCSQNYKPANLSVGSYKIYIRTADLAGNFGTATDYSWTIIASSNNSNNKTSVTNTPTPSPTLKASIKHKTENDNSSITNPFDKIPEVIKPLIGKLPFIPGESLVSKQLKPDTKIASEVKPLEIIAGKVKPSELKIFEEVKTTFTNNGATTQKSEIVQPVALVVENTEGNYVKVAPVTEEGPKVDTQNQRIIVTAGTQISVQATGYAPNAEFAVWLRSDPVFIGRGYANRFGEINETFDVPKNVPVGDHKIELNGLTKKKEVRSVAVPATVIKYTNPGNIQLVTENPVEKYLNGLSVLMSLLFTVLMVGLWAVGATIRDQRLLRAQIRK